jgi:hypothetical protein
VLPQPRRRWACFPNSIVSDYENQEAHLYRAMARHIAALQDEARFYEERANPWLRNMLTREGAASFLDFQRHHPEVDYTTYDPRTGAELADWLTRVLATVDIVVVDSSAPSEMVRWIGELTRPRLHTFLLDPRGEDPSRLESMERIEYYTGICIPDSQSEAVQGVIREQQRLIPIQPSPPAAASNGQASRHIERSAQFLVNEIVRVVDESLLESDEQP